MKTVRALAAVLYTCSRIASIVYLLTAVYTLGVVLLYTVTSSTSAPIRILPNGGFQIYYPFTTTPFLLGEYNAWYIGTSVLTISFYGLFLWLLGDVFYSFKQTKLFTRKGFLKLSRFYIANLTIPILIFILLASFGKELNDIIRITFLHLVVGVFAFFMAAIFKQGLNLQDEQDLIF